MKRYLMLLFILGLVTSSVATAQAGNKKPAAFPLGQGATTVHETFGAALFPFPKDERWNGAGFSKPGCYSGEEGVHWVAHEFTAPGKGSLRFWMEAFVGDHDIYLYTSKEEFIRGDQTQVGTTPAPPEEEIVATLKKGQTVTMVACNWLGQREVQAHYEGTFK